MNSFKEFYEQRTLNEVAIALPAIPYLIGGASALKSFAISLVVTKLGYDALTSESVKNATEAITAGGVEVAPLTTATPEVVVDAIAPHVTAEGAVAATAESASAISSALGVGEAMVQSVLTYAAGIGLSPLAVSMIFGAGLALTAYGTYKFFKSNGPNKFKNLLKKALKALLEALKLAGAAAVGAFMSLTSAVAAAIASAFSWLAASIGAGTVAIIKKIVDKFKKADKEEEVRDLEDFELDPA